MDLRAFIAFCFTLLMSPVFSQQGDLLRNMYVSYSNQQMRLERTIIAHSYYRSQDQPVVESMFHPASNHRQSFAVGAHKSVYTSENYRHDIYAGLYARASFLSTVLTQDEQYEELERTISDDPKPTLTLTERFGKTWLSYNADQLETGLSLEAVYRFNRRFNLHYGFRAGLLYPTKVRYTEVKNEELRRTISSGSTEQINSTWKLDSRTVHQAVPISWASDALLGFDYKLLANRPFYLSVVWLSGMVQLKGTDFTQVAPFQGMEFRISSNL